MIHRPRTLRLRAIAAACVIVAACGGEEEADVVTDVAVHTAPIARVTLHRYVTAYGYVEPAPAGGTGPGGATLAPLASGVLTEIRAVEGRRVEAGEVLFRLDSRLAEVAVRRAEQGVAFAESTYARQQRLIRTDGTSQRSLQEARQQLDQAQSGLAEARTALAYLVISAPIGGTIVDLNARVGQMVDGATVLARIVDLNRLVVTVQIPEAEAQALSRGQAVRIGPDSAGPRGTVMVVGREIDPTTGTYRVQASIPAGAGFSPGQFLEIHVLVEEHPDVLAVPENALVTRAGEGSWIAVVEDDQAVRRPVVPGLRDGDWVEVTGDGLREGLEIVTTEAYSLPERTGIHRVDQ